MDKKDPNEYVIYESLNDRRQRQESLYVKVQFELFAALSQGRNFVWRVFLEEILLPEFLFTALWDKKYSMLQSSFFEILINLYIDQAPFEENIYPEYIHILGYKKEKQKTAPASRIRLKLINEARIPKKMFKPLMENLFIELEAEARDIKRKIKSNKKKEKPININGLRLKTDNKVNYTYMINLLKMAQLFIKLNSYEIFENNEGMQNLVKYCLKMIQFNQAVPGSLHIWKEICKRNEKAKRNKIINLIGNKEALYENYSIEQKVDTSDIQQYPIIRNFFFIKNLISELNHKEKKLPVLEIQVKSSIVEILNNVLNNRQNFLVHNLTSMLENIIAEKINDVYTKEEEDIILKKISEKIPTIFPPIMKTSLIDLDQKNNRNNKFERYVEKTTDEIYDLDFLQLNQPGTKTQKQLGKKFSEVLPSLVLQISIEKNREVVNNLIKLMLRLFSQRREMIDTVFKVSFIHNAESLSLYKEILKVNDKLQIISKRVEVIFKLIIALV